MWSQSFASLLVVLLIAAFKASVLSNPVSSSFNASLRDYSVKEHDGNATAKTLQQEEMGRYANFAPVRNPVRFKDVPDNALSSSTYPRGLLHDHDHGGYPHDYDDSHYGYGYEYDHGLSHHLGGHHPSGHHLSGHHLGGHHLGGHHGYHHKHYDHALAAKTILWPLAGLALLGTAAALVSNPVLLQLGVISGRRRRDTKEIELNFQNWKKDVAATGVTIDPNRGVKRRLLKHARPRIEKAYQSTQSAIESVTPSASYYNGVFEEDRFVPIPLKMRH